MIKKIFKVLFAGRKDSTPQKEQAANQEAVAPTPEDSKVACCSPKVHIAYRGVSDDRLYMSYDRTWGEVKFFRPNGLKVFCAGCRTRVF